MCDSNSKPKQFFFYQNSTNQSRANFSFLNFAQFLKLHEKGKAGLSRRKVRLVSPLINPRIRGIVQRFLEKNHKMLYIRIHHDERPAMISKKGIKTLIEYRSRPRRFYSLFE